MAARRPDAHGVTSCLPEPSLLDGSTVSSAGKTFTLSETIVAAVQTAAQFALLEIGKMTKSEAKKITQLFNSIIVWGGIAEREVQNEPIDLDRFYLAARRHNEAAGDLLKMGIVIPQFVSPYLENENAKISA